MVIRAEHEEIVVASQTLVGPAHRVKSVLVAIHVKCFKLTSGFSWLETLSDVEKSLLVNITHSNTVLESNYPFRSEYEATSIWPPYASARLGIKAETLAELWTHV